MRNDLRQLEVPDVVQKYRVRVPESQSLGWRPSGFGCGARRSLGRRPFVPWGCSPMSLPFPCSLQGSILHATGAPEQGKHQINPACSWIVKISHMLKLHATDLSLPCLLQGRSQHATRAPLHHSSFLSSAGCCQDTASGDTLRPSTCVERGLRWMFKDTLHTDMHMSSWRWRDAARGRHNSVQDNCSTTCSQAKARVTTKRVPWPSPLGLPREARGVNVVKGVHDEVLQEVPRPTAR